MKRLPIYIVVMIAAFIAASFLSAKLNKEQLKFAPEKATLSGTPIAGFHKFASDVQWMRLVNYLGSLQTVDESNVGDVSAKLQELVGLDPAEQTHGADDVLDPVFPIIHRSGHGA